MFVYTYVHTTSIYIYLFIYKYASTHAADMNGCIKKYKKKQKFEEKNSKFRKASWFMACPSPN